MFWIAFLVQGLVSLQLGRKKSKKVVKSSAKKHGVSWTISEEDRQRPETEGVSEVIFLSKFLFFVFWAGFLVWGLIRLQVAYLNVHMRI